MAACSNQDPRLGPLDYNGGPTPTQPLLPGSPALNAGDDGTCQATDQRGTSRPQGAHCDIGAYEAVSPFNTPTVIVTTAGDVVDAGNCATLLRSSLPGPDNLISLREAICAANNGFATRTITFDPALLGQTLVLTNQPITIGSSMQLVGLGTGNLTISGSGLGQLFWLLAAQSVSAI